MSAITGICDLRAISASASASSCDGTATRTIWHPAAVSSAICCSVALTSAVSVVVIDWTETGAPPPTGNACLPEPTTHPGQPGSGALVADDREVPAIQRQQRQQVEQADEDVQRDDDQQQRGDC